MLTPYKHETRHDTINLFGDTVTAKVVNVTQEQSIDHVACGT